MSEGADSAVKPSSVSVATTGNDEQAQVSSFFSTGKYGTYMSFMVLVVAMIISIIMQRTAPDEIKLDSWEDGCPEDYENSCKANSAVFRISFALSLLFAVQILGSIAYVKFYDILWVPKIFIFIAFVFGFYFADSEVFGLNGYAWFARITGFLYLILQQIILLDLAYSWNEKWVEYSTEDGEKGQKWLVGILVFSAILFAGSFTLIGIMFWQFDGCTDNDAIISITLVLPILATLFQLFFTDEGSILISAIMTAYATYVCYSAVSLNPELHCNPTIDTNYQTLSTVMGLIILVISLLWTTYNTIRKIPVNTSTGGSVDLMSVATGGSAPAATGSAPAASDAYSADGIYALFIQVSFVFLLISGYYAMVLTNWAIMQANDSQSDPRNGRTAMWIQAAGQWIAVLLYIWSLMAPKILTNREF